MPIASHSPGSLASADAASRTRRPTRVGRPGHTAALAARGGADEAGSPARTRDSAPPSQPRRRRRARHARATAATIATSTTPAQAGTSAEGSETDERSLHSRKPPMTSTETRGAPRRRDDPVIDPGLVRKVRARPGAEAAPALRRCPPPGGCGSPQGEDGCPDGGAIGGAERARARGKRRATHARRPDRPASRIGGAPWRRRRMSAARPPLARPCRGRARRRRPGPRRRPGERRLARPIGRGNRNPSCPNDPAALAADQAATEALWITRGTHVPLWITVPQARVAMTTSAAQAPRPPVRQPRRMQEWTPWLTPRSRRPATATTTS